MKVKRWKVFLDTSALIAGVVSPTGAAREVLRLCEAHVVDLILSKQVLTEADRNISAKLSAVLPEYHALLKSLAPMVVDDPVQHLVKEAGRVINQKGAPILAAARDAEVDYLVSWDTRHFHTDSVRAFVRFQVVTPGEFLRDFRRTLSEEL